MFTTLVSKLLLPIVILGIKLWLKTPKLDNSTLIDRIIDETGLYVINSPQDVTQAHDLSDSEVRCACGAIDISRETEERLPQILNTLGEIHPSSFKFVANTPCRRCGSLERVLG